MRQASNILITIITVPKATKQVLGKLVVGRN
jgi:hypothetical protein